MVDVGGASDDGARYYLTGSEWIPYTYRHNGRINVLFADGHVSSMSNPLPTTNTSELIWDF
jgi:prepilin-type processing-associated H-X9-DG protein